MAPGGHVPFEPLAPGNFVVTLVKKRILLTTVDSQGHAGVRRLRSGGTEAHHWIIGALQYIAFSKSRMFIEMISTIGSNVLIARTTLSESVFFCSRVRPSMMFAKTWMKCACASTLMK